jgi:hemoglobin
MKSLFAALVLAAACALPAHAADDTLYRALGGRAAIGAAMTDLVARLKTDPSIGHFFKDTKADFLAKQLADQVCQVAGGPCEYEGANMKDAHADLEIRPADFNRLVELLQDTLDARGVPFATQRALLARLAPMHRDVIARD